MWGEGRERIEPWQVPGRTRPLPPQNILHVRLQPAQQLPHGFLRILRLESGEQVVERRDAASCVARLRDARACCCMPRAGFGFNAARV